MGTRLIDRSERLEEIERMLLRNALGLRAVEIAEACGVDRRTIYRDLSLLSDIGVPIYQKDGRFYINRDHYTAMLRLSFGEVMALVLALRLSMHAGTTQNPHTAAALSKLAVALPETIAVHVHALIGLVNQAPVDRGVIFVLDTIMRAWSQRRRVRLWYSGDKRAHEFATFFVEVTPGGELYVVGMDSLTRRVTAIALERIKRVKELNFSYDIPRYFEPRHYYACAWGSVPDGHSEDGTQVVLAFAPELTPQIQERILHPHQKLERDMFQRCLVSMMVQDWREMLPWLRAWGSQVEVLQPQALRAALADEYLQLAARYAART